MSAQSHTSPVLTLNSIDVAPTKLTFAYAIGDAPVNRAIDFPEGVDLTRFTRDPMFQKLIRYAALGDAIYMFNFAYFDYIDVPFELNDGERQFFEETYYHGLAEFRYTNGIAVRQKTIIRSTGISNDVFDTPPLVPKKNAAFVLNGGGKDGATAMEIAKKTGLDLAWFSFGQASSRRGIVAASGVSESFVVERRRDLESPLERIYEGHKPMSLYVAMVSALCAYINRRYYVIAANEYSANFPNLEVEGFAINHQYSKSFVFERSLHQLFDENDIPVRYFSIVRPLYELQIVKLFSRFDSYHEMFISCNHGIHHDQWCLACAKCAFVIGAFYFFEPAKATVKWGSIQEVYGSNPQLIDETIELVNPQQKPFECIGTYEENQLLLTGLLPLLPLSSEQRARYNKYQGAINTETDSLDIETLAGVHDFPLDLAPVIERSIKEIL